MRALSILLAVAAAALVAPAVAGEFNAGPIAIGYPWTRPTPGTVAPGVGYMVLDNRGPADDRLVSAASPVAQTVTMHRTEVRDGIARMLPQEAGIAIPAHGSVSLEPGGYHLMLGRLKAPLALGQTVPLTLTFERAGAVTVELRVERRPAVDAGHGAHSAPAD